MKKISPKLLSEIVERNRKQLHLTQLQVTKKTGINRTMLSHIEAGEHIPSVDQLLALSDVLNFNINDIIVSDTSETTAAKPQKRYKVAVAGTGYVGLSLAVLLSQQRIVFLDHNSRH